MGKVSEKGMDGKEPDGKRPNQYDESQDEGSAQSQRITTNTNGNNMDDPRFIRCLSHSASSESAAANTSRLAASASSPSLLTGCANASTHAGANIERHVHSHNVQIVSQSPPLSPIPVSPHPTSTDFGPFQSNPRLPVSSPTHTPLSTDPDIPHDSVFLTPSQTRSQHLTHERPNSAPSNYLEKISGTLLRLVGDHYLCSNCGRQLRTIGDQLTMETNINHIRRAFSATHLDHEENDT